MIKVVVVDSGICTLHSYFKNRMITTLECFNGEIKNGGEDEFGHGTAISGIIARSDENIHIISIKIRGIEQGIDEVSLINVLQYINTIDDVNIVNLSLGVNVCEHYNELYASCKALTDKGIIIISAFDNTGSISYPAAFDNVIGVISGNLCRRTSDFEYVDDNIVNVAAYGNTQRVAWTTPQYMMIAGNSFACAHVTSKAIEFIKNGIVTKENLLNEFSNIAIYKHQNNYNSLKSSNDSLSISKAILFPFNKEMHSLVRYSDLLSFEIVDIYDTKYTATIGRTTCDLLNDNDVKEHVIKNIDGVNWDDFDTIILGHISELITYGDNRSRIEDFIKKAVERNKQIYSFDDISKQNIKHDKIFCPKVVDQNLPLNRFGMLYRISKPVVGVFGTSSRQGKFTLQLKIRQILLKNGYDVGQIGTEPTSLLYGMDYVYPMGYNSTVEISGFDSIRYLNNIVNELCMRKKDIIIVGSQSGTIPYDTGNIVQYTIPQIDFLLGTCPDCVVLCINPFDNMDYIKRTIAFIESVIDSKVIAVVVFPVTIDASWQGHFGKKKEITSEEFQSLKVTLENETNISVYRLGREEDMIRLVELVTDFFS